MVIMNLLIKVSTILILFFMNPPSDPILVDESSAVPCYQLDTTNWHSWGGTPYLWSSNGYSYMEPCFNFTGSTWSISSSINTYKQIERRTVYVDYETSGPIASWVTLYEYDGTSGATLTHSFTPPNPADVSFLAYTSDVIYTDGSQEVFTLHISPN